MYLQAPGNRGHFRRWYTDAAWLSLKGYGRSNSNIRKQQPIQNGEALIDYYDKIYLCIMVNG